VGQHFSAIAAAGPIVGPILAGLAFGWLPALLWIVLGAIFIGAVHDFSSLFGSVRHKAGSIAQIVQEQLGRRAYILFLGFIWLSLIYVITAFADLTSSSFAEPVSGGAVASSSLLYLALAVAMGIAMTRFKMPLAVATWIFLPLLLAVIWAGQYLPLRVPELAGIQPAHLWNVIILGYCFIASVLPVWLLLQPRGYLGGIFLYLSLIGGIVGLALGGMRVNYPAFLGWQSASGLPLFPMLFVTVACGACSGFHGIVCSGTTSKQIAKETDCLPVGYGGMLLECLVAFLALATVMILVPGSALTSASPDRIYAEGLGRLVQHLGVPHNLARSFVLLAFTTFIYDTLDVATRLARYILQELTGWKGVGGSLLATAVSLLIPFLCVTVQMTDAAGHAIPAWKVFWTLFGTSNQLLAALTLMILSVWLWRTGKPWWFSAVPMAFMLVVTFWSLYLMVSPALVRLSQGNFIPDPVSLVAIFLSLLAVVLIFEAFWAVCIRKEKVEL